MKALVLVVLGGCLVLATCFGCRGLRSASLSSESVYKNVILPKTDLADVTIIEACDRIMEIYRELLKKHMEAEKCTGTCTSFPGLHYTIGPLSQGVKLMRLSIHLEDVTIPEALKCIASNFGLTLSHQGDSFREGCFVLKDPNYKPELDSLVDPFGDPFGEPSARK